MDFTAKDSGTPPPTPGGIGVGEFDDSIRFCRIKELNLISTGGAFYYKPKN